MRKSHSRMLATSRRRNSDQLVSSRIGAGSTPASLRIAQTVLAASLIPSPARVLARKPHGQLLNLDRRRGTTGTSMRIRPAAAGARFRRGRAESRATPQRQTARERGARACSSSAQDVIEITRSLAVKYRLPLILLEQTAMRVNEVVSLERDDIDAAGLRFRIKAINRKGRRGPRKARLVPVPSWLTEIVAISLPLSGRLFPNVTANGLRSAMSDLCEQKGLTHCSPHHLRHRRKRAAIPAWQRRQAREASFS